MTAPTSLFAAPEDWGDPALATRIDRAVKKAGTGRIGWVHPDCGFWMLKRSVADRKIEALVCGRDKYLGRK